MVATKERTHLRDTFCLEIASNPTHSTFARSHALHAGNLPSHFCFRVRQRTQEEMARATLYEPPSAPGGGDSACRFVEDLRWGGEGRRGSVN